MEKINIEFDLRRNRYSAVIRVKPKPKGREFYITVLDWRLERILYDNHIMEEVDGAIQANVTFSKIEQTELKLIIGSRLSHYLKIPCFVGDQRIDADYRGDGWGNLHPIPRHDNHFVY